MRKIWGKLLKVSHILAWIVGLIALAVFFSNPDRNGGGLVVAGACVAIIWISRNKKKYYCAKDGMYRGSRWNYPIGPCPRCGFNVVVDYFPGAGNRF